MDGWKKASILGGIWGLIASILFVVNDGTHTLFDIVNMPAIFAGILMALMRFPVPSTYFEFWYALSPLAILFGSIISGGTYLISNSFKRFLEPLNGFEKALTLGGLWGLIGALITSISAGVPSGIILSALFLPEKIIFLLLGPASGVVSTILFIALSTSIGSFIGMIYHTISKLFDKNNNPN